MDEEKCNINEETGESSAPEEESNAARRLRLMGISVESEEEALPSKKKGLKAFLENFWYHYKFVTLMVLVAAVAIGVGVYQYVTKVTPDIYIMCSGRFYYENTEQLMMVFATVMVEL